MIKQTKSQPVLQNTAFVLLSLETVKYIIQKQNKTPLEKILEIEETGSHLGERICNYLLNFQNKSKMVIIDIIKFIAIDIWNFIFQKSITRLKTDSNGTYLLESSELNIHSPLIKDKTITNDSSVITDYVLTFVNGILKGVLSVFNIVALVNSRYNPDHIVNDILNQIVYDKSDKDKEKCSYLFTINILNADKVDKEDNKKL